MFKKNKSSNCILLENLRHFELEASTSKRSRPNVGVSSNSTNAGKLKLTSKAPKRGKNNNAVPDEAKTSKAKGKVVPKKKFTPIIQTRKMKAQHLSVLATNKLKNNKIDRSQELQKLNLIDTLTSNEIVDGDVDREEIMHDRVELSINGLDIKDFLENEQTNAAAAAADDEGGSDSPTDPEPGQILSSEDESDHDHELHRRVASKVVKPTTKRQGKEKDKSNSNKSRQSSQPNNYDHLRNDPDFRRFLDEMVDDRMKVRKSDQHDLDSHKKCKEGQVNDIGRLFKSLSDTDMSCSTISLC